MAGTRPAMTAEAVPSTVIAVRDGKVLDKIRNARY
jgi:hypothetical protein